MASFLNSGSVFRGRYVSSVVSRGVMITPGSSSTSLLHDKPIRWEILTSDIPYVDLIGSCLSVSSLYTLRKVNLCHQNAYDQHLFGLLAREILGEHQHDVEYLEAAVHIVTQNLKFLERAPIALMAALLEHGHWRVRTAAVSAFPLITARGDSQAIDAVIERFGHADRFVRSSALNALAKIADRGNGAAIAVVVAGLEDADPLVRVTAVRVFVHIAEKNDAVAIAAVVNLLDDTIPKIRCAALRTLSQIATKGDADVIAAVLTCLEDPRARDEAVNTYVADE